MIHRAAWTFSAAAAVLLLSTTSYAAPRAFVASTGSDANTASACSPTLPCRSFAAAYGVVDTGGEVIALDSAGYGTVNITKSVTIAANPGVIAGVVASTGAAIEVGGNRIDVKLRGLSVKGMGASYGISFWGSESSLSVENCVIGGFSLVGIQAFSASLRVVDSLLQGNRIGIWVLNAANASIARTRLIGQSSHGIAVDATLSGSTPTSAVITDSISSHNGGSGIHVQAQDVGMNLLAVVTRTTTAYNNAGMVAFASAGNATLVLDGNLSTRNTTGVQVIGAAVVESAGNNTVRLNTTDVVGTMTPMGTM